MLRNGQDRSLRMWKSSGRILSEYTKRVLRRADGEHWPLQMEHASWYMAIVCSSALYELLGGCNLVRRTEKGRLRRRGWGLRWEKAQKGGKGTNLRGFFED